jgi:hypothetical protein
MNNYELHVATHTCHDECQNPICVAVRKAVAEEREACARLCFQMWSKWMDSRVGSEILDNSNCPDAEDCAFAIRERGAS